MRKQNKESNGSFLLAMTADVLRTHWRQAVSVSVASVVFLLLLLFIPRRAVALLCVLLWSLTTVGVLLVILISKRKSLYFCMPTLLTVWFLSMVVMVLRIGDYSFVNGSVFPFWRVPLVLGGIFSGWITVQGIWKKAKMPIRLLSFLLLFVVLFCTFSILASHLNYALDSEKPISRVGKIEAIDSYNHKDAPTDYCFTLTVGDETVYLDVSWRDYLKYEVGDRYSFEQYQGAFGKPFYMATP